MRIPNVEIGESVIVKQSTYDSATLPARKQSKYNIYKDSSSLHSFENKRLTRLKDIGSMLSGLSKPKKNRKEEKLKRKSQRRGENRRFYNKREKNICEGRLTEIETMKKMYMPKKIAGLQSAKEYNLNTALKQHISESVNGELQKFTKERDIYYCSNCTSNERTLMNDKIYDNSQDNNDHMEDASMR
eukprot:334078_1